MSFPSTHFSLLGDLRDDRRRDESWAAFSARYRGVIHGWCVRRGLRGDEAEDLTQDVLLKLFQHLPVHRHDPARGRFRSWLKAVVNNTLTDYWRRRGPDRDAVGGAAFLERVAEEAESDAAAELSGAIEEHDRATAAGVVARVRAKLKETTWQAFYQTAAEGRPAVEVAAALNLGVASVYKATYRVKRMLREEYDHVHASGTGPDPLPRAGDA